MAQQINNPGKCLVCGNGDLWHRIEALKCWECIRCYMKYWDKERTANG